MSGKRTVIDSNITYGKDDVIFEEMKSKKTKKNKKNDTNGKKKNVKKKNKNSEMKE